ncbi:MAG: HAMP domain-containing protein [Gammaproteobacteria bacterium]|nr:HAMP domain-containing protein [Gammaproteobacteria bacterium]
MFSRWRRALYLQVYVCFVGIVVLFFALSAAVHLTLHDDDLHGWEIGAAAAIAEGLLPPAHAPPEEVQQALERWHEILRVDLAVRGPSGVVIAAAGYEITAPEEAREGGWVRFRGGHSVVGVRLADGRWVLARKSRQGGGTFLGGLAILALAIGLGAYPLARRITRRLERLRASVDALGAGELSSRVNVEGRDEVAELAVSFNRAAAHIEALVGAQRSMLAGASHELRTPLTRIRMAIELLDADELRADLRENLERDIRELDSLIDELLTVSRLQACTPAPRDTVDIYTLASDEAQAVGAELSGSPSPYVGEVRWLRRLLRNLLVNAMEHGGPRVSLTVNPLPEGGVQITVDDDGPGIPEDQREQVFQPFYRPPGIREGYDRGVGFGLALVRQIAERHGGTAECAANENGGSRFVVRLGVQVPDHQIKSSGT